MSIAVRASVYRKAGDMEAACANISAAVRQLLKLARRLGAAVRRETSEIGSRAVAWHQALGLEPPSMELEELRKLTGVSSYDSIS